MPSIVAPPQSNEVPDFFKGYVLHVEREGDAVATLERQRATVAAWNLIPPDRGSFRYAEGKWSIKEVIGHIIDAERIFSYRLLRIGRGDRTPLASFDENAYVASSEADARDMSDLVKEMTAVRESSLALVRSLGEKVLANRGTVRAGEISARAQAFVIAGHFAHHVKLLQERYGVASAADARA